jgi:hypothetical protein
MNLQDQVIYRCIHAACARPLPRKVNFCPYCGTGQHEGVVNPHHVARPAPAEYRAAVAAPVAPQPVALPPEPVVVKAEAVAVPPPAAPAPVPAARKQAAAPPPRREPVRMRYWLIAIMSLWLIWIYARPSTNKIEARIASATLASQECRFNDAQSELIALRMTKATKEQLARLQGAINAAYPGCEKKKLRVKAWSDTTAAVEVALAAGDFAKAQSRLAQFTRRYDEDEQSAKLKEKIAAQRAAAPPAPPPFERMGSVAPQPEPERAPERTPLPRPQTAQSVRNLITEAERALAAGNYKSASDKLETCITMVDAGNRECAAFKVHADRMQREQSRCLAGGREWIGDRCS